MCVFRNQGLTAAISKVTVVPIGPASGQSPQRNDVELRQLAADFHFLELAGGIAFGDLFVVDTAMSRFTNVFDIGPNDVGLTFDHHFDASVREVSHPA